MVLYSCQLPFLPFNHSEQYRLPKFRWTAAEFADGYTPTVACDPGWSVLARHNSPEWWQGRVIPPLV
jgi:hypothetical protein